MGLLPMSLMPRTYGTEQLTDRRLAPPLLAGRVCRQFVDAVVVVDADDARPSP
jgi:hypothetical protein